MRPPNELAEVVVLLRGRILHTCQQRHRNHPHNRRQRPHQRDPHHRPTTFGALLAVLKQDTPGDHTPAPRIDITFGEGEGDDTPVYLRDTSAPDNVVTTSRRDWEALVLGVRAGEFDHVVKDGQEP